MAANAAVVGAQVALDGRDLRVGFATHQLPERRPALERIVGRGPGAEPRDALAQPVCRRRLVGWPGGVGLGLDPRAAGRPAPRPARGRSTCVSVDDERGGRVAQRLVSGQVVDVLGNAHEQRAVEPHEPPQPLHPSRKLIVRDSHADPLLV